MALVFDLHAVEFEDHVVDVQVAALGGCVGLDAADAGAHQLVQAESFARFSLKSWSSVTPK